MPISLVRTLPQPLHQYSDFGRFWVTCVNYLTKSGAKVQQIFGTSKFFFGKNQKNAFFRTFIWKMPQKLKNYGTKKEFERLF